MNSYFIIIFFNLFFITYCNAQVVNEKYLVSLPDNCSTVVEARNLEPLWLRKCEAVCDFKDSNKIKSKRTVYYPIRLCSDKYTINYLRCEESHIKGCNVVVFDKDNILNHTCDKSAGLSCSETVKNDQCVTRLDDYSYRRDSIKYETYYAYCR